MTMRCWKTFSRKYATANEEWNKNDSIYQPDFIRFPVHGRAAFIAMNFHFQSLIHFCHWRRWNSARNPTLKIIVSNYQHIHSSRRIKGREDAFIDVFSALMPDDDNDLYVALTMKQISSLSAFTVLLITLFELRMQMIFSSSKMSRYLSFYNAADCGWRLWGLRLAYLIRRYQDRRISFTDARGAIACQIIKSSRASAITPTVWRAFQWRRCVAARYQCSLKIIAVCIARRIRHWHGLSAGMAGRINRAAMSLARSASVDHACY